MQAFNLHCLFSLLVEGPIFLANNLLLINRSGMKRAGRHPEGDAPALFLSTRLA